MPGFDTPAPISVTIELVVGNVRITASDRTDTVVEVHASDESHDADVRAAAATRIELDGERLLVAGPRQRALGLFGRTGSIDVTIGLPAGSAVSCEASVAAVRGNGSLGACRITTSVGDVALEHTARLEVTTSTGTVEIGKVDGPAEISTGSGRVRLHAVTGSAVVGNSNGDTWVGDVGGDLRVKAANGHVTVEHAGGGVTVTTANGDVRVGEVVRGTAALRTANGEIELGIGRGTAALLDASTQFGAVHNQLDAADGPAASDQTVEARLSTGYGDIVIHRA